MKIIPLATLRGGMQKKKKSTPKMIARTRRNEKKRRENWLRFVEKLYDRITKEQPSLKYGYQIARAIYALEAIRSTNLNYVDIEAIVAEIKKKRAISGKTKKPKKG